MCGIIGYTGHENATPYLVSGLEALEYGDMILSE